MTFIDRDPTAGERGRAIREGREDPTVTTDPTAGERARALRARPDYEPPITDPTDPRCGRTPDAPAP